MYPPLPQMAEPVVAYPVRMAASLSHFHYYAACYDHQSVWHYLPPSSPVQYLQEKNGFSERAAKPFVNGSKEIRVRRKVEKVGGVKEADRRNRLPDFTTHGRPLCFRKKSPRKLHWTPRKLTGDGRGVDPPPPVSLSSAALSVNNSHSNTTVMIKNIPNQLRRDDMLNFLDQYCFEYSLEYDFMYLPMDFRKWDNLGYGFVNFTTPVAAMKFMEILQNFKWEGIQTERGSFTSKKICEIIWAKVQGKEGYVRRFQDYTFACDQLEFLPVLLDPPRNGSDPKPPPVILGNLIPPRFRMKKR